jgi:arylsulfatase A-like enzyme
MNRVVFALIVLMVVLASSCGNSRKVNVLLILTDTVRADHLSCYGYERNTTPCIDSLAAAGTLFERCQGQSSWTLPAMATIMSGVSPVAHGAGKNSSGIHGISHDAPWLPIAFHRAGYRTAAFVNVMFMNEDFGFHRGFQHFSYRGVFSENSLRKAGPTVNDFLEWLDSEEDDGPFFAAVHFYDPHIPYRAPEPFNSLYTDPDYNGLYGDSWGESVPEMMKVNSGEMVPDQSDIDNLVAMYDGELSYMDSQIGRLLAELRERGLSETTIVVVVADHGEEFYEHNGIEHGRTLYQETTHVPLIISGPGFNYGGTVPQRVAQLDVAGTIAAAAGIEFEVIEPAVNLAGVIEPSRSIPASGVLWRPQGDLVTIVSDGTKLIWSVEDDSLETYDLTADPSESNSVEPAPALLDAAEYYWATPPIGEAPIVDCGENEIRELRNLGYIR